jgi:uncharacterized damage-inducible protein DinB
MPSCANLVRLQFDYNVWADQRLVTAVGELPSDELNRDFGTADKSVLGTLVHVFGAERLWLGRFQREAKPPYLTPADYHLSVLQNDWPSLHDRWRTLLDEVSDEFVAADFDYHDMKGHPWRQPLWQLILHVVNHGTHHRGQVAGFLRTLGRVPPPLDITVYYRETYLAA